MKIEIDNIEGDGSPGSAPVTILPGDEASLPSTPSFPDVQTAVLVGGILGFGFGIAFAMIRTVSDRRIRAADDVEQKTGVAVVGTIPIVPALDDESRLVDSAERTTPAGAAPSPSPKRCAPSGPTSSSWMSTIRRRRSWSRARSRATASRRSPATWP